jgi:hypothetical protein
MKWIPEKFDSKHETRLSMEFWNMFMRWIGMTKKLTSYISQPGIESPANRQAPESLRYAGLASWMKTI